MSTDTLILGGVVFNNFSPPDKIPFGGKQAMAIHKLPGGSRVIDLLGPDDHDITFNGIFFDDNAMTNCMILDGMRKSGAQIPLIFGGMFYNVIIAEFTAHIVRYPNYVEYSVTCMIAFNPMSGIVSAISAVGSMIASDISSALSLGP